MQYDIAAVEAAIAQLHGCDLRPDIDVWDRGYAAALNVARKTGRVNSSESDLDRRDPWDNGFLCGSRALTRTLAAQRPLQNAS